MPLPVTFAELAQGDQPASLLDTQFNALAGFVVIPCFVTGQNDLQLEPFADAPLVPAYTDLSPLFTFIAPQTSTGNVTLNVSGLGAFPAFKNNGLAVAGNGDLQPGGIYRAAFVSSLNNGSGGFVIDVGGGSGPVPPENPAMISMQLFTSSGTYTPPANFTGAIVEGVGGGGAGGDALADGTNGFGGGGGGSGGYFKVALSPAQIGASQVVTIGPGGAPGNSGGTTSFGTLATATGGSPGAGNNGSTLFGGPGAGGTTTLGGGVSGLQIPGQPGTWGQTSEPAPPIMDLFGGTGGSVFGGGGLGVATGPGSGTAGNPGSMGAGGGGAVSNRGVGGILNGGNGGSGWVLVTSYTSA